MRSPINSLYRAINPARSRCVRRLYITTFCSAEQRSLSAAKGFCTYVVSLVCERDSSRWRRMHRMLSSISPSFHSSQLSFCPDQRFTGVSTKIRVQCGLLEVNCNFSLAFDLKAFGAKKGFRVSNCTTCWLKGKQKLDFSKDICRERETWHSGETKHPWCYWNKTIELAWPHTQVCMWCFLVWYFDISFLWTTCWRWHMLRAVKTWLKTVFLWKHICKLRSGDFYFCQIKALFNKLISH